MDELLDSLPRAIRLTGCTLDLHACVARWPDEDRTLTPTETRLVAYLISEGGRVVDKRELLKEVWGYRGGVVSRTVKTTMGRLRAKIERDPSRPDHLLTVSTAGYRYRAPDPGAPRPSPAPPARIAPPVASPLPEVGPLVGRDADVEALLQASAKNRLVSLVGPAGVGKSSLAVAAAQAWLDRRGGDELRWCAAGDRVSLEDLVRAVAQAAGVGLASDEGPEAMSALVEALAGRGRVLLVLDELERILDPARTLVRALLDGCPGLGVLCTSREALAVAGETVRRVAPLDAASAAILFRQRAGHDAQRGYTDDDRLTGVLDRLDGLPLAIELAAGWASLLAPEDLAGRLVAQLDLLRSPSGNLRATIASSWQLLDEGERSALAQLAVFAGPAPVDALDAVLELPDGTPPLPVVRRLLERSLARRVPAPGDEPGSPWIGLFEAVRQYAREQGDPGEAVVRHGAWFAWVGDPDALAAIRARGGAGALAELTASRADLELTVERAVERDDPAAAAPAMRALLALARARGPLLSYRGLVERVLAMELPAGLRLPLVLDAAEALVASMLMTEAAPLMDEAETLARQLDDGEALSAMLRMRAWSLQRQDADAGVAAGRLAVEVGERTGDVGVRGRCAVVLGVLLRAGGQVDEAEEVLRDGVQLARAATDLRTECAGLYELGQRALDRDKPVRALSLLQGALQAARDLDARPLESELLGPVASLEATHGSPSKALAMFDRALELQRQHGDRGGEGRTNARLGAVQLALQDHGGARATLERALAIGLEHRDPRLECNARARLGQLFLEQGRHDGAARMLHRADELAAGLNVAELSGTVRTGLAELDFAEGRIEAGRAGMAEALELFRGATLHRHSQELLDRWAGCEADVGALDRAEELTRRASEEGELTQDDLPSTLLLSC